MRRIPGRRQGGFTMIELAFVIAIISIMAAAYLFTDSGARGKAVTMLSTMTESGNALMRLKSDTGCHTQRIDGLFNRSVNTAANTFCGNDLQSQWRGPYTKQFGTDASNRMTIDKIVASGTIEVRRDAAGLGRQYYLRANNVPNDLIRQFLAECNGVALDAAVPSTFAGNKCRGALGSASTETGTADLMFDETT